MAAKGLTHPAELTNGGRFANGSAALRARHSAYGLISVAYQIYNGGRGAELFRSGTQACPNFHCRLLRQVR
jgi:hypothetical protein